MDFCAGEKRSWLHGQGMRWLPNPRLARARRLPRRRPRQLGAALPHHLGHRPRRGRALRAPRARGGRSAAWSSCASATGSTTWRSSGGAVTGVRGHACWRRARSSAARRATARRSATSSCAPRRWCVTTGGIGGNHELVREKWPERLGEPPKHMLSGVPAHVDGRMLAIAKAAGANEINGDRMWHYVEGIHNWDPIWPMHAIRIIPGPSSLWFDADRQPAAGPALPRLRHARHAGAHPAHRPRLHVVRPDPEDHREGVRAVGLRAEPRHHVEEQSQAVLKDAPGQRPAGPVQAFKDHGEDFVVERDLPELVAGMNALDRRRPDRPCRPGGARSWPATARSTTPTPRTARSRRSTAPAPTSPTRSRAWRRRTRSSTPTPGR